MDRWIARSVLSCMLLAALASFGAPVARQVHAEDKPAPKADAPEVPEKPADPKPADPKFSGGKDATGVKIATAEIDLNALLVWTATMEETNTSDPVWALRARPAMTFVSIPFKFAPSKDGNIELDHNTIKLAGASGAKFVAWRIERKGAQADDKNTMVRKGGSAVARNNDLQQISPDAPPRYGKKLTITPDGKLKWKLEKLIQSGEVKQTAGQYKYKIDPLLLAKEKPEEVKIAPNGGEKAADFAKRKRDADLQYRAKQQAFLAKQKAIQALPSEFEEEMPERLWAVWEVKDTTENMTFEGPPPLPWKLTFGELEGMRYALKPFTEDEFPKDAAGKPDKSQLPDRLAKAVENMTSMIKAQPHPYSLRTAAYVISTLRLAAFAVEGDALYKLLVSIMDGSDTEAKLLIAKEVSTTIPPTAATLSLLKKAKNAVADAKLSMPTLPGGLHLPGTGIDIEKIEAEQAAKKTQFDTAPLDFGKAKKALDAVNIQLLNKDGADVPVSVVMRNLLPKGTVNEDASAAMRESVDFDTLFKEQPKRFDEAVVIIVNNAPTNLAAAEWLNQKLLGSADRKIVMRTLELLNSGEVVTTLDLDDDSKKALAGAAAVAVTVPVPVKTEPVKVDPANPDQPAAKVEKKLPERPAIILKTPLLVQIKDRIVIVSRNDTIMRLIKDSDRAFKDLAWKALRFYAFSAQPEQGLTPGVADRFATLITAALEGQAPLVVVDFLARHNEPVHADRVMESLARLVQRGGGSNAVSLKAGQAILGRPGKLQEILTQSAPEERRSFARRLFEANEKPIPLVVGMLKTRSDDNPLVGWFASQVQLGRLPDSARWSTAYERDPQDRAKVLLQMVGSFDENLAQGAVAALVSAAGGDERDAQEIFKRYRGMIQGVQGSEAQLAKIYGQWHDDSLAVFNARLKKSQGAYRVRLVIHDDKHFNQVLGQVELRKVGENVSLGANLTAQILQQAALQGIRLVSPSELASFNNAAAGAYIPKLPPTLDLLPQSDGQWRASFNIDKIEGELILEPAKDI